MSSRISTCGTAVLVLAMACGAASATVRPKIDQDVYRTAVSLAAGHPNERARWHGLWNYSNGQDKAARKYFEQAAYYGDKPSQYVLTVMSWTGEGGSKDPVQAYIWSDLAAERGNHSKLLGIREYIWNSLTEEQRVQVAKLGPVYHQRYGDATAMRRTSSQIARFSRSRTGSRAGGDSGKMHIAFGAGTPLPKMGCEGTEQDFSIAQKHVYGQERVDPRSYWAQQDVAMRSILVGTVTVGEFKETIQRP